MFKIMIGVFIGLGLALYKPSVLPLADVFFKNVRLQANQFLSSNGGEQIGSPDNRGKITDMVNSAKGEFARRVNDISTAQKELSSKRNQ